MEPSVQRITDRYLVKLAVQEVYTHPTPLIKTASSQGLTPAVVQAFMEGFYLPMHTGRVAFRGLVQKAKQLVQLFGKAPQLWKRFKALIGIEGLMDIPKAIKELAKRGYQALQKVLHKAFQKWPLKLYTLEKGKLHGLNALIDMLLKKSPAASRFFQKAKVKTDQFGIWLRKAAPTLSAVLVTAIYMWIWMNVVEFEWDMQGLTDAVTGSLSLSDLLASLPSSGLGFLLKSFRFGTFTLLPATIVARVLWMVAHRYIEWTGSGFRVNQQAIAEDFGVPVAAVPTQV
jgi:hypothetical protein